MEIDHFILQRIQDRVPETKYLVMTIDSPPGRRSDGKRIPIAAMSHTSRIHMATMFHSNEFGRYEDYIEMDKYWKVWVEVPKMIIHELKTLDDSIAEFNKAMGGCDHFVVLQGSGHLKTGDIVRHHPKQNAGPIKFCMQAVGYSRWGWLNVGDLMPVNTGGFDQK